MSKIQIETAQNVTIEYELASVADRLLATLLDYLIIFAYVIGLFIISAIWGGIFNAKFGVALGIIFYLPVFFYDLICEVFLGGQSIGKKIKKIKVVKLDGSQPTVLNYFLRWVLKPVDIFFTYGSVAIVTILVNGKGQRLGDLAANTTVIKTKVEASLDDTIYLDINRNYEVIFPQVSLLNDQDIATIKEVIDRMILVPDIESYYKILIKTKEVISQKMGIASDMHALEFLGVIIKDYNYVHNR